MACCISGTCGTARVVVLYKIFCISIARVPHCGVAHLKGVGKTALEIDYGISADTRLAAQFQMHGSVVDDEALKAIFHVAVVNDVVLDSCKVATVDGYGSRDDIVVAGSL